MYFASVPKKFTFRVWSVCMHVCTYACDFFLLDVDECECEIIRYDLTSDLVRLNTECAILDKTRFLPLSFLCVFSSQQITRALCMQPWYLHLFLYLNLGKLDTHIGSACKE